MRIVTSRDLKLSKLSACGPNHVVLLFFKGKLNLYYVRTKRRLCVVDLTCKQSDQQFLAAKEILKLKC